MEPTPDENRVGNLQTIQTSQFDNGQDEKLGYQHTLMYGKYTQDLSAFARKQAQIISLEGSRESFLALHPKKAKKKSKLIAVLPHHLRSACSKCVLSFGENWVYVFLVTLGITMAIISFIMDWGINSCLSVRNSMFTSLDYHVALQYFAWTIVPVVLVLFSAGLVHVVAPQAIGSGIPEMKAVLRGTILTDYLTFRTLFAKVIGLVASLGSGMPLGKEGPFVHIASIVATQLAKLRIFKRISERQSKGTEMLAAACAVGVACCFAAPVGGVLMSIEVTSEYFAVRDYWRGFFAAAFGATFFRLLAVWFQGHETLKPVFRTYLGNDIPYDPQELIAFAFIGMVSGLLGAAFVYFHRAYVLWMRGNKKLSSFLQKNRFIYPVIISWFIASATFPIGFGQFIAGSLNTHDQVITLFSNFSWTSNVTENEKTVIKYWLNPYTGVLLNLSLYVVTTFAFSLIASTLPVPSGNFVPMFKMGAAVGRLFGEVLLICFPKGFSFSGEHWNIIPGGYAVVGAAAVAGAVTRTISVCVIVAEMTGQITYILPVILAVLIANAVAGLMQPSIFDSIAVIKKLPYVPDFIPSGAAEAYNVLVKDFMVVNVTCVWHGMSYKELQEILRGHSTFGSFPLVDNQSTKILLGSIDRPYLEKVIQKQIGRDRKSRITASKYPFPRSKYFDSKLISTSESTIATTGTHPNRFEVTAVDLTAPGVKATSHASVPKRSILKKTLSLNDKYLNAEFNICPASYETVTGVESERRAEIPSVFKKSCRFSFESGSNTLPRKCVQLPRERVIDMPEEYQNAWEEVELDQVVDFSRCPVDPLPIQLVEQTSLLKVHSLFSLLRIHRAYVTSAGRLTGVVSMRELREAIEECNAGTFVSANADDHSQ